MKKHKFQNYKICLEATRSNLIIKQIIWRKMNLIETVLKKIVKKSIKNNKLILKMQQRSKGERDNVYTEKINKIAFEVQMMIKEYN